MHSKTQVTLNTAMHLVLNDYWSSGSGITNAVGMAIFESLGSQFNKPGHEIVTLHLGILGDGRMMEGISHEACSLAVPSSWANCCLL